MNDVTLARNANNLLANVELNDMDKIDRRFGPRPPRSAEVREKMSKAQTGKKLSAETKEKIGAYWRGKTRPDQRQDFCKRGHDMNEPGARHAKRGHCVKCKYITDNASRKAPHRKAAMKAYMFRYGVKKRYGITHLDYARMMVDQNGVCAICKELDSDGRVLSVDHDHATGAVRALLCHQCNLTLGKVRENTELLRAMIDYLESHKNKAMN